MAFISFEPTIINAAMY